MTQNIGNRWVGTGKKQGQWGQFVNLLPHWWKASVVDAEKTRHAEKVQRVNSKRYDPLKNYSLIIKKQVVLF